MEGEWLNVSRLTRKLLIRRVNCSIFESVEVKWNIKNSFSSWCKVLRSLWNYLCIHVLIEESIATHKSWHFVAEMFTWSKHFYCVIINIFIHSSLYFRCKASWFWWAGRFKPNIVVSTRQFLSLFNLFYYFRVFFTDFKLSM